MALIDGTNGPLPTSATTSIKNIYWHLVVSLVAAGWQRIGEGSDGVGFANETQSPGVYDSRITGDTTWGDNGWIRLRQPTGTKELLIAFDASPQYVWTVVSLEAGFITGGAHNVKPTAADEVYLGGRVWLPTSATYRPHVVASDTPDDGQYFFYLAVFDGVATDARVFMYCDPLQITSTAQTEKAIWGHQTGSGAATYNSGLNGSSTAANQSSSTSAEGPRMLSAHAGSSDLTNLEVSAQPEVAANGAHLFPRGLAESPWGGDDICMIRWGRPAVHGAQIACGTSRYFAWKGVSSRAWPDTRDLDDSSGQGARVYFDDVCVPWPTGIVPVL